MKKMFVHYSGTVAAFKAAGLESQYTNHIVFIKGGENGAGEAVYTHGQYYGNVKDALAALQKQVNDMKYFSSVRTYDAEGKEVIASAAAKDGIITFSATDPAQVNVEVGSNGVAIGLSKTFTDTVVNNTSKIAVETARATTAEGKIREDLGQKDAAANAEGSAFARIAQVKADLEALQGEGGSVANQIKEAIEKLDAEITSTDGSHVNVKVTEVDGKITAVNVTESDIASASNVAKAIEDEAKARENADNALAGRLDKIEGEEDGSIKKAVAVEKQRAESAEGALASRLDKIEGEDAGSIKKAVDDAKKAIEGELEAEDAKTLAALNDKIETVAGDAKSYTIRAINVENEENVKEAWGLFDEDNVQAGSTIKIYKDSSLKAVALDGQILNFTYILANGSESTVGVDVSAFLHESEYGNGLQVIDHVVSVKMDEASESFLSVGANGIKLSGIQNAFDAEGKARKDAIEAEAKRAKAAEEANATAIKVEAQRAKDIETHIYGQLDLVNDHMADQVNKIMGEINKEAARADAAEKVNAAAITAETQRAQGVEEELRQAISNGNSDTLEDAKEYFDGEIDKLNVEDAPVENKFVTAVSQTNGKISVSRSSISASQIGITNTENDAFAAETQNVQAALTELASFWEWEEI